MQSRRGWGWRRGRGRPVKPRVIRFRPRCSAFAPSHQGCEGQPPAVPPVYMALDELEAVRLVDYEGLLQEEAASLMGISRGTLWRLLEGARRKLASMAVEGRQLVISAPPAERERADPR